MFLILTVLAVIIADVYGENLTLQKLTNISYIRLHNRCITSIPETYKSTITIVICVPDMEFTFSIINEYWVYDPIWDDDLASEALKEALKKNTTEADFKIRRKRVFPKSEFNETTMAQKVVKTLSGVRPYWIQAKSSILPCIRIENVIPPYAYYGCNGIFYKKETYDVMTVVCLYKKKQRSSYVWHKYKNIEVNGDI